MKRANLIKLIKMAEKLVAMAREEGWDSKFVTITADASGYMSLTTPDKNDGWSMEGKHWCIRDGGNYFYEPFDVYTCFDCKYCSGPTDGGRCLCKHPEDVHDTHEDMRPCKLFEKEFRA